MQNRIKTYSEIHGERVRRGKALAKNKAKLAELSREMLEVLKEAYQNSKGLDVPGEGYEAPINRRLRLMIEKAERAAGV
jgi:hypothetical protein